MWRNDIKCKRTGYVLFPLNNLACKEVREMLSFPIEPSEPVVSPTDAGLFEVTLNFTLPPCQERQPTTAPGRIVSYVVQYGIQGCTNGKLCWIFSNAYFGGMKIIFTCMSYHVFHLTYDRCVRCLPQTWLTKIINCCRICENSSCIFKVIWASVPTILTLQNYVTQEVL